MRFLLQTAPRTAPSHIRLGAVDWPLVVRRHARARRIGLRVAGATATLPSPHIVLTLPARGESLAKALRFLEANRAWLAQQLGRQFMPQRLSDGVELTVLGQTCRFQASGALRGISQRQEDGTVLIHGPAERFGARVVAFLTKELETFAREVLREMPTARPVRRLRVRSMEARWGSCNHLGDIALNWRLALASTAVAQYVVAHEVAHLKHMDHSPAFWAEVRALMPDMAQHRAWLKAHGSSLYRMQP